MILREEISSSPICWINFRPKTKSESHIWSDCFHFLPPFLFFLLQRTGTIELAMKGQKSLWILLWWCLFHQTSGLPDIIKIGKSRLRFDFFSPRKIYPFEEVVFVSSRFGSANLQGHLTIAVMCLAEEKSHPDPIRRNTNVEFWSLFRSGPLTMQIMNVSVDSSFFLPLFM